MQWPLELESSGRISPRKGPVAGDLKGGHSQLRAEETGMSDDW